MIEPDIAKVFTSAEQVNKALRALISAMPDKKVTTGKYAVKSIQLGKVVRVKSKK